MLIVLHICALSLAREKKDIERTWKLNQSSVFYSIVAFDIIIVIHAILDTSIGSSKIFILQFICIRFCIFICIMKCFLFYFDKFYTTLFQNLAMGNFPDYTNKSVYSCWKYYCQCEKVVLLAPETEKPCHLSTYPLRTTSLKMTKILGGKVRKKKTLCPLRVNTVFCKKCFLNRL